VNKLPIWRAIVMVVALSFGLLYTLPNFFGEAPAVQVSSTKSTVKVDQDIAERVNRSLQIAGITAESASLEGTSVRVRLPDTDTQLKAKDAIDKALNTDPKDPRFVVALNLVSSSPGWLSAMRALPMYLGLDLRGGVHFLLQVDMPAALSKRMDVLVTDSRTLLRDKNLRHSGISRTAQGVEIRFRESETRQKSRELLNTQIPDLNWIEASVGGELALIGSMRPETEKRVRDYALKQNITTLSNRVNELGVAEPVIQQQGPERIVVQLPGVQDTAKAKDILGRTATLEIRMVEDSLEALNALASGRTPAGLEIFTERGGGPILLKREVVLTGESLTDAQAGFDSQNPGEPAVHLTLDSKGARIFRDVTRESIGRRMAILLVEKGKGEVVTAPVIRSEIPGGRVQISGRMTTTEAADVALLLRAGSLAAPMEIIEERTIGPSLGADNIKKGFNSTLYGFIAVGIFMMAYYLLFGAFSVAALSVNLLLLFAILSLLQATLTLPGIAAIALTLGMAVDANVLINERVREELRNGLSPQAAIQQGYDRAWATILDSNVTTLIAGVALLVFGSGPVRGFAVVHCLGIMTSIFSAVFFSRGLVNLWYGGKKKLAKLSIG
jgi:preprotein translocase subunit SecD